jgi:hypothetical protein
MSNIITESGMDFIAHNTFHIERSPLYTDKLLSNGIKTVEFIRADGNKLIFVEAKKTFPKPDDGPNAEERVRFANALKEVCEKFVHSLNLYSSVKIGVSETQLPEDFLLLDKVTLKFVLVVKNHKPEWCRKIQTALVNALPSYLRMIWKPTVCVINHDTAINQKLAVIPDGNINNING